jgi:hypothetical protein
VGQEKNPLKVQSFLLYITKKTKIKAVKRPVPVSINDNSSEGKKQRKKPNLKTQLPVVIVRII